jgi:iron complex outermembrane receptor protein
VESGPGPERLILPVTFRNGLHGRSEGVEITADYRPVSWWRWTGNYSLLRTRMTRNPGSTDVSQERRYEGLSPRHQVELQAAFDLPRGVFADWLFRYASDLPAGPVPAYATSNVRVAWSPHAGLEIAVVGQDLHESRHLEWAGGLPVRRRGYISLTWRQR